MPRNPLDAVQTQRASRRDVERAALAKLLDEDSQLEAKLNELLDDQMGQLAEVAGMSQSGRVDVRAAAARRYYATQLRSEAVGLAAARQELAKEIAVQRSQLAAADAAVKAVENLIEKRAEEQRVAADRRTQIRIEDEWAAGQAARK